MSKKTGIILISIGAVLIMSALLLFIYNEKEDRLAAQRAEALMGDIQTIIDIETDQSENTVDFPAVMPTVEIDGYEYIGYLSVPDLGLELPIMADWDYARLTIAPCRHFGSAYTDDLVIAAHNYKSHFGYLSKLEIGAKVYFTDANGNVIGYVLKEEPKVLGRDAVEEVQNSGFDLVLYTCTPSGKARVAAFFDRFDGVFDE